MSQIQKSLRATEKKLKLDVDAGKYPRWYRLIRVLQFLYLFPDAEIFRHPYKDAYHLQADHPSSLHLRRTFRDCPGRIVMSEKRLQKLGAGGDIMYKRKGTYRIIRTEDGRKLKWIRKPEGYEPCELEDILRKPWKKTFNQHLKRRQNWWRKHGRWR